MRQVMPVCMFDKFVRILKRDKSVPLCMFDEFVRILKWDKSVPLCMFDFVRILK